MKKPPPVIDSAVVRAFATIVPEIRYTGRQCIYLDGKLVGPAKHLAVCENADDDFLLLLCDESWEAGACVGAPTMRHLLHKAERWYEGVSSMWEYTNTTPTEDRANLEAYFEGVKCSFCHCLPRECEKMVVSEASVICDKCVVRFGGSLPVSEP